MEYESNGSLEDNAEIQKPTQEKSKTKKKPEKKNKSLQKSKTTLSQILVFANLLICVKGTGIILIIKSLHFWHGEKFACIFLHHTIYILYKSN